MTDLRMLGGVGLDAQTALLASGHAFSVTDAREPDFPLTWVNPAFERLTGYRVSEAIGRNCRFLQGPESDPRAAANIRAALAAGRSVTETLVNYRPDGSSWWNEVTITPVHNDAGELTHFVGVQSDVGARVEADARRDAALAEAHLATARLALLAEAGAALAATSDPAPAARALARLLVPAIADWCRIELGSGADAVSAETGAAPDELADPEREADARSSLTVPVLVRGRDRIGSLTLACSTSDRAYSADDADFAAELSRRIGDAFEASRTSAAEHDAALALQRSLLPVLPLVDGLELAARYVPGSDRAEVGGDWYDVLPLPDGSTGIAVGDAMGHDIQAAAAMGQLRSVLRSYAWEGHGPAEVLDRLNQLVCALEMARIATCVYARVERSSDDDHSVELRWANAGHPAPMLRTPDGVVHVLDEGASTLIGVTIGNSALLERASARLRLPVGSTLLIYTDGLIESRERDIDAGMAALYDSFATADPGLTMDELADLIVATAGGNDRYDDQCLLLARIR